ncbi:MAG: hypothetical protein V1725_08000 [archaeon]
MDVSKVIQTADTFKELELHKTKFNMLVVEELLQLFGLHEQQKLSRDELMRCFTLIEKYDWALMQDVYEMVVLASSGKIKNDSYYRAIKRNLEDLRDILNKQNPKALEAPPEEKKEEQKIEKKKKVRKATTKKKSVKKKK